MQLLFERSPEHGGATGLGLLPGEVVRLDARGLKLPHIGWNVVTWRRPSPLIADLGESTAFYHVHSYVPVPGRRGHRPRHRRVRCAVRLVRRPRQDLRRPVPPGEVLDGRPDPPTQLREHRNQNPGRVILYPAIDISEGKAVRLRQGSFDDVTVYEDDPLGGRPLVDGRRRALPARRGPRRRPPRRAPQPAPPRAHQARAGHPGPVRRRPALAAGRPRRAARRGRPRDHRHGRVHRRRLPRRRGRRLRRPRARRGRHARRPHRHGRLDPHDADARRGRHRAAAGPRREAVRLHERRPRRDARGPRPRGGQAHRGGRARALPVLRRHRAARRPRGAGRAAPGEPRGRHRGKALYEGRFTVAEAQAALQER